MRGDGLDEGDLRVVKGRAGRTVKAGVSPGDRPGPERDAKLVAEPSRPDDLPEPGTGRPVWIRLLACAGLGSVELRVAVLRELARACPFEGAFFPTADPATLLYTSAVRVGMPDGLTGRFLDNEFNTPDVNKFRSLAAAPTAVATLDAATNRNQRWSSRGNRKHFPAR